MTVTAVVVFVVVVLLIVDDGTCEEDEEDRFPTKFFKNCSILCHRFEVAPAVACVELSIDDVFIIMSSGTFSSLSLSILNNEDAMIVLISARLLCSFANWVSD